MRFLRATGLLLALATPLAGCADGPSAADAVVENVRLVRRADGTPVVSGLVRNDGDVPLRAQVTVGLYDEDNRPIGDERVDVGLVPPGEVRPFERALDLPAVGARVRDVLVQ